MEMNAEHMSYFVESAKHTFSTMLRLNVQMGKLFAKEHDDQYFAGISGIVGLSGDVSPPISFVKRPKNLAGGDHFANNVSSISVPE